MLSAASMLLIALWASPQIVLPSGFSPLSREYSVMLENRGIQEGQVVLGSGVITEYFTGFKEARSPDLKAVQQLAKDAAELEAHFDTLGANRLRREVLELFERTPRPTTEFRNLTAQIGHDLVGGFLAEGNLQEASSIARYVLSHFATHSMDSKRHSPAVRSFYGHQRKALGQFAQSDVELTLDQQGTLFIEGDNLGPVTHQWKGTLVPGHYRVWLQTSRGWSLPYRLSVGDQPVKETISTLGQWCIHLTPYPYLDCKKEEADVVKLLFKFFPTKAITIVEHSPEGKLVERRYGPSGLLGNDTVGYLLQPDQLATLASDFNALRYLPLGVGQWVQKRYYVGASFLLSTVALAIWHGVALNQYAQARADGRILDYSDARFQQNLSGGLLYAVVTTSVIESVLSDWLE